MFEPSDEQFQKHVWENPDDEYASGIYADWLKEQGDPRGEMLDLFQIATSDKQPESYHAFYRLVDHFHSFYKLCKELSPVDQYRAAIELVVMDSGFWEFSEFEKRMLSQLWHADTPEKVTAVYERFNPFLNETLDSVRLLFGYNPLSILLTISSELSGNYFSEKDRLPFLVVVSFYLFGHNILQGSFERNSYQPPTS